MVKRTARIAQSTSTAAARGKPGRPRSARAQRAILDAAAELFIELGFDAMSVEAVATRAAVGKATIYRRWSSKEELVIDAIDQLFSEPLRPDTGSAQGDLVELAKELHALMNSPVTGGVFPRMAAEIARGSRLGHLYAVRVIRPRRAIMGVALRRGMDRGDLPTDTDVELAVDLLVGTLLVRRLTGQLGGGDAQLPKRVAEVILAGLRSARS